MEIVADGGVLKVVCARCSYHCSSLAYRAYRRSRVCDNCDVILKHKIQRGLCRHDNASLLAEAAAAEDADVCSSTIDEGLLNRNNEPLCSNVSLPSCHYKHGTFNVRFTRNYCVHIYHIYV